MTEQPIGLLKTAIKDPAVRLAALCGAVAGAVLVLAVVVLAGKSPEPPEMRAQTKTPATAAVQRVAPIAVPPAEHVHQPAARPKDIPTARVAAPESYPDLPVSRVDEAAAPTPALGVARPQTAGKPAGTPESESAMVLPPVAPPPSAIKPRIAIVIDDMGVDQRRSGQAMTLPGKVTLSFLPYARKLREQATEAAANGHEVMLHVAMEPESPEADPGPNVLLSGVPKDELLANLRWNLDQMSGYQGINNHMGSRFTRDLTGMRVVMAELKARGLFFLDSVTSRDSVGARTAREAGVPYATRDIFIDHKDEEAFVRKQLAKIETRARKHGIAIAIAHPRDITIRVLKAWLPKVQEMGFELVGVSEVLHRPVTSHSGLAGTSG